MLDLNNPNDLTATLVLLIEICLLFMLLLARYNARRLKIGMHHRYVYTVVIVNTTIITTWMLPKILTILGRIFSGKTNPISVWYYLLHATFGSIAIILGLFVCVVFFLKVIRKELIPLPLLRRMKPIMVTTFIFWILAFLMGVFIYINKYIYKII